MEQIIIFKNFLIEVFNHCASEDKYSDDHLLLRIEKDGELLAKIPIFEHLLKNDKHKVYVGYPDSESASDDNTVIKEIVFKEHGQGVNELYLKNLIKYSNLPSNIKNKVEDIPIFNYAGIFRNPTHDENFILYGVDGVTNYLLAIEYDVDSYGGAVPCFWGEDTKYGLYVLEKKEVTMTVYEKI